MTDDERSDVLRRCWCRSEPVRRGRCGKLQQELESEPEKPAKRDHSDGFSDVGLAALAGAGCGHSGSSRKARVGALALAPFGVVM